MNVHKKVRLLASGELLQLNGADPSLWLQESFIKLGFHLVMFFFYLYSMIVALIKEESH